jgi:transposase
VGVAPFDDDSGKRVGQRSIQGGRRKLRNVFYMAAMGGATRHNPVLNAYYTALINRGKLPKVAIIACLRKLLTILNTMVAQNKDWDSGGSMKVCTLCELSKRELGNISNYQLRARDF